MRATRPSKRLLLLGAAILLVGAAPAFACAPQTKAKAEPARAEAGSTTTIHGTGFDANGSAVQIYWGGQNGALLATAQVNAQGNFAQQVTIPRDAQPGNYWMQAAQGDRVANFEFAVTSPQQNTAPEQPAPAEQSSGSESLPGGVYEPAHSGPEEPAGQTTSQQSKAQQTQPATQQAQPATQAEPRQAVADSSASSSDTAAARTTTAGQTSRTAQDTAEGTQQPDPAAQPAAQADLPVAEGPPEEQALPAAEEPGNVEEQPGVEPMPLTGDLGGPQTVSVGPSPTVLVPLAAVALGLFLIGGAIVTHELRQRRAPVEVPEE